MITTPHTRPFAQPMIHNLADAGVDLSKLVLYSTFDDDSRVTDVSGGENHGTLSNGAYFDSLGRYGKSVFFDSTNDAVTFANESKFDIGATEDFSIWFWVKPRVIVLSIICSKAIAVTYYSVIIGGGGVINFEVDDGVLPLETAGVGGIAVTTDNWYQVAVVFNRTTNTGNVYINGVVSGSTADITGFGAISNATSFNLGNNDPLSFGCNIDMIGFTKEALDINTIQNLYNKGL